eukprot:5067765-Amphidinium_carterae.1
MHAVMSPLVIRSWNREANAAHTKCRGSLLLLPVENMRTARLAVQDLSRCVPMGSELEQTAQLELNIVTKKLI